MKTKVVPDEEIISILTFISKWPVHDLYTLEGLIEIIKRRKVEK